MLAYFLALAVGFGSIALYLVAFFFPEIHRKNDFIWSGVGFFYALVLWVFARRITGGLLLGHVASVALLGWFGWQTFSLRRQLTPQAQQTQIPDAQTVKTTIQAQLNKLSLNERLAQFQTTLGNIFSSVKDKAQQTVSKKKSEISKNTVTAKPIDRHVADKAQTVTSTNSETTLNTSEPLAPEVTTIDTPAKTATEENTTIDTPAKTETESNTLPVVDVVAPEAKAPPENIPPTTPTEG